MDQVSFEPPETSGQEESSGQRSAGRDSLMLFATLRISGRDDATIRIRIRNLSPGGLMAVYGEAVSPGTVVEIEIRGIGWIGGRIAWAADGRIGVEFDRPVDPLAARRRVEDGAWPAL
jgi:hypothetical protein